MNSKYIKKFQKKIELDLLEGCCWMWKGFLNKKGYGRNYNKIYRKENRERINELQRIRRSSS